MKYFTLLVALFTFFAGQAQCEPDFDFGEEEWGASPDASAGEQFDTAYVDVPYADVFHVLVPTDASAIDPLFQLPLDSVILTEVILTDTVTLEQYTLADIGLEIVCNNLGSSPDPCTLIAGAQYCASLEGTPTAGGVFQMSLDVAAWVTVFGLGVAQPYSFAGYILDVIGEPINEVGDLQADDWSVYPNPANDVLTVQKTSPNAWVEVYNVAGQTMTVSSGNQPTSHVLLETASWTNGLYFVVHHDAAGTSTRRVVVQH
jgi:hypothetical protein